MFNIQRKTLVAGSVTPITPPVEAHALVVGNATQDDLRIYSQSADVTQYEVLAAGFEYTIQSTDASHPWNTMLIALYLNAISGGPVTLRWL